MKTHRQTHEQLVCTERSRLPTSQKVRVVSAPDRLLPARECGTESGASDGSRHTGIGFTVGVGEKANGGEGGLEYVEGR